MNENHGPMKTTVTWMAIGLSLLRAQRSGTRYRLSFMICRFWCF